MITDTQKKEIDTKYFPNGFFWQTKNFDPQGDLKRLNEPFESLELYDSSVKSLLHSNALRFFWTIEKLSENDFIKEINSQYLNYTIENMENAELWLSLTYDIVLKGVGYSQKINDTKLRAAFIEWHKSKLSELKPCQINNNDESKETQQDENVFCKTMPLNIPREHFKALTLKKSKNGLPYLTQNQFNDFINRAFLGKINLPKQKFNQAPKGEKLKIQYLFRKFYENYCFEYFNTGQTQDIFIELLTENFIGWEFENVKNNFKTKPKKLI